MTDTSAGHLDLDALAELEEGLTEPQAATAARAHLDGCEDCRALLSTLRTTRALLSALPAEPMPERVAARLDAALAGADLPAATIVPLSGRKRPWQSPALAGGVAAAAVVVLVAAIVAGTLIHHGKKSSETTTSPTGNSQFSGKSAAQTKQWATGTNYTPATIASLVPKLVTQTPPTSLVGGPNSGAALSPQTPSPAGTPATASVPSYTQEQLRNSPEAVLACGQILAGGVPTTPVAVDFARFDGKPAVIFVLPAVGHPGTKLDVWVVRSTCSSANFDLPLFRVDRP